MISFVAGHDTAFLQHNVVCYNLISAINKAYKTLENEEGLKRCKEIVEEATSRTNEMVGLVGILLFFKIFFQISSGLFEKVPDMKIIENLNMV